MAVPQQVKETIRTTFYCPWGASLEICYQWIDGVRSCTSASCGYLFNPSLVAVRHTKLSDMPDELSVAVESSQLGHTTPSRSRSWRFVRGGGLEKLSVVSWTPLQPRFLPAWDWSCGIISNTAGRRHRCSEKYVDKWNILSLINFMSYCVLGGTTSRDSGTLPIRDNCFALAFLCHM